MERIAFIDRMVGTKLDLPIVLGQGTFEDRESGGGPPFTLVRILDLGRCAECLSDLAAWNAATSSDLLDGLLLLVGEGATPTPLSLLRGIQGTRMVRVDADRIRDLMGPLPPDAHFLLSEQSVVLMAEARSRVSDCAWSFPSQVAGILGSGSPNLIRSSVATIGRADILSQPTLQEVAP